MTDLLLLIGTALCALSVLVALIDVARTEAPRAGAGLLLVGLGLIFLSAWLDPRPFTVGELGAVWQRVIAGQFHLMRP